MKSTRICFRACCGLDVVLLYTDFVCRSPFSSNAICPLALVLPPMPNGCIEAACDHCQFVKTLHPRNAEDYNCWIGAYCDDCNDWINRNQEHWRLFHIMQMVDKSCRMDTSEHWHPLSLIIADDSLGHIIASFAEQCGE